jgi:hypothetical protein
MPSNPTHEAAVKRVVRLAAHVPESTWQAGRDWYDAEADWIADQAIARGFSACHANMAFAALSPRTQYGENRKLLIEVMDGAPPRSLRRSWKQAEAALAHGKPPSGPKVRAFACNLNGCMECVTVDVWMARLLDMPQPATVPAYRRIERVFQGAAKRLGVAPRDLQAALWIHTRGVKASDPLGPYRTVEKDLTSRKTSRRMIASKATDAATAAEQE